MVAAVGKWSLPNRGQYQQFYEQEERSFLSLFTWMSLSIFSTDATKW